MHKPHRSKKDVSVNWNAKKELEEAGKLHRSGRRNEALSGYRRYLEVRPNDARAWAALGGLLLEMGQMEASREASSTALRLDLNQVTSQVNLANAFSGLGLFEASETECRKVLVKNPHYLDAILALVRCLYQKGDPVQARSLLEALIVRDPKNKKAHGLLVEVLIHMGQWQDYDEVMGRLISLHAHPPVIEAYDRGLLDLRLGNLPPGWARYESRLECPGLIIPKRNFTQPRWDGLPFQGKTLLVHYEQGLGDTFMFVRYATRVKALRGRVPL
jgi:tetratricopeptide (TPR) repeat protein